MVYKVTLVFLVVLFSSPAYALDVDKLLDLFDSIVIAAINAGRLIGLIIFGLSWWGISKSANNPNQFPLSRCLWGMVTGIALLMAGVFYSAYDNTIQNNGRSLDNTFLAMDVDALRSLAGTSGTSVTPLGIIIPPDTMVLILGALYVIGVIAFIKGLYSFKDSAEHNPNGSGAVSKGLVYSISGYFAMNITFVGCAISELIGMSILCPAS